MEKLHITPENIARWLEQLIGSGRSVYAPVRTGERVDFKKIARPEEVASDYVQTTQSVKKVVFPRTEELFSYRKEGKQVSVRQPDLQAIPETVVWKIRPCDAAGFASLSGIFNWDYKDGSYNARAERLTLISFSCATSDEYCFCTSVGGGPGSTTGSDIQLTLLPDGGALVEVLTPKGERLAAEASSLFTPADGISKEEYLARVEKRFDARQLREKLDLAFDSPVWQRQSERCLGCGACAFVCPTCACFDIQEDARGATGRRVRCWDSCGFSLFTLHTSGHNPRPVQSARWRQRVLHKFSYMPERIGQTGCTGCGRCSRACPVNMNLLEHLQSI